MFNKIDYALNCQTSAAGINTAHNFSHNTFENCYYGIKMRNGLNDVMQENAFNPNANDYGIPTQSTGSSIPNKYGIYLDGTSGFNLIDNKFTKLQYGLVVVNSGSIGGFVTRQIAGADGGNIFDGCWRALNAIGDNPKLSIKCNQFKNSNGGYNNFSVTWYVKGKMKNQGLPANGPNPGSAAGNTFLHPAGGTDLYAQYASSTFTYYHNSALSGAAPTKNGYPGF